MRVKLPSGDLNPNSCPPHPTNTYTYRVTTAPEVHDEKKIRLYTFLERVLNGFV